MSVLNSNLIYDIGMNNGDDTAYYLSLGYEVIAVEANPFLVSKAMKRFKEYIENKKLQILNVGITESNGYMDFYINNYDSGWSSFHLNLANRGSSGYEAVKVETKSLARLITEYGIPYYIKIDIEGNDRIAMHSLKECAEKPKYLSIELYGIDEIDLLNQLGYNKFKIIDQQNLLPLEIPLTKEYIAYNKLNALKTSGNIFAKIARKLFGSLIKQVLEKKYKRLFNYNHPFGSSGTFGENYPGKWHSLNEIKELFLFYKNRFEQSGDSKEYGWWIDIHATY
jgi:FkbM family methyltransferase